MKKIINKIESIVDEMVLGFTAVHQDIVACDEESRLIFRKNSAQKKVALLSGGGSGHEPAHAGFVGEGMLDVAVCGDVFASPSTMQVYEGILKCGTEAGVLLVIKNYSGDIMNFEAAAELAEDDGIKVDKVYVNDDVAVKDSLYTVGRRGVAGTVFVHKIAGAAAEAGKSLAEVKAVAEKVVKNCRSIGFALTSCTVPAKGGPTFSLDDKSIEYGVGIHGEPGIAREALQSSAELAKKSVDLILADFGSNLESGDDVVVLVNGFGATPLLELYVHAKDVLDCMESKGFKPIQSFVGNYMTSLDMAGASITILRVDDELRAYLNAPAHTAAITIK